MAYFGYKYLFQSNVRASEADHVIFIPKEASFDQVMDSLRSKAILLNEASFIQVAKVKKYPELIKSGRYTIGQGWNNQEIVNHLRAGNQDAVKLVINNVRTKAQLAGLLGSTFQADSLQFLTTLNDSATTQAHGFSPDEVTAMFLANTYNVYWDTTPEALLARMKKEYDKFWTQGRVDQAKAQGLSPFQAITLAAIVEEETKMRSEMPIVAGLYLNRLNKGWNLEADPTLKYAAGDFSITRVLNKHKEIDSPYNTYMYAGLPPGPIRIPESYAIEAVLQPKDHDYMFMCASADFDGSHAFAKTLAEHNRNARKYQAALNERRIFN